MIFSRPFGAGFFDHAVRLIRERFPADVILAFLLEAYIV
jgi:hypothetical protein